MRWQRSLLWVLVALAAFAAFAGARRRPERRVIIGARVGGLYAEGGSFPGFAVLAGETLSPRVDLAVGVGYEYTPDTGRYGHPDFSVPIFAHARWRWGEGAGSFIPCLQGDAGVTFSDYYYEDIYRNQYDAGTVNPFVAAGPGVDWRIGSRLRFTADLGYRGEFRKLADYKLFSYAYLNVGFFLKMERAY